MDLILIQDRIKTIKQVVRVIGSTWNRLDDNHEDASSNSSNHENEKVWSTTFRARNCKNDYNKISPSNENVFIGDTSCFPSLLLNASICPIKCQNLQELEQLAVSLLSQPIMVSSKGRFSRNHQDESSLYLSKQYDLNKSDDDDDDDDTDLMNSCYKVPNLSQVPRQMALNLSLSFMKLLRARAKAYAVLLLRHYNNSNSASTIQVGSSTCHDNVCVNCGEEDDDGDDDSNICPITEEIIELLWHQTFVATITTKFEVDEVSCNEENISSMSDGTTTTVSLQFEAALDVSIFGHTQKVLLKTSGELIGYFSDSKTTKLDHVTVELDTSSLFKLIKDEVMDAVDQAMFTIKSTSLSAQVSNHNPVSEDDEEICMEKIGSLQQGQLEDVLDNILRTADELHAISVKEEATLTSSGSYSDYSSMPPPLPRVPRSRKRSRDLDDEPCLVSPLLSGMKNTSPTEITSLESLNEKLDSR